MFSSSKLRVLQEKVLNEESVKDGEPSLKRNGPQCRSEVQHQVVGAQIQLKESVEEVYRAEGDPIAPKCRDVERPRVLMMEQQENVSQEGDRDQSSRPTCQGNLRDRQESKIICPYKSGTLSFNGKRNERPEDDGRPQAVEAEGQEKVEKSNITTKQSRTSENGVDKTTNIPNGVIAEQECVTHPPAPDHQQGQQVPGPPQPQQGQQVPGPPQPQQGQQVPGPPQPQQGQQVPGPPQPQQGQQVPGPPQPQQGQQVPGPPQPQQGQQVPGPPQPQQGQQVPGPPQPQQGQQVPGPPQPQQGQQVPGPPQPQQGQQVPGPPQPQQGQQVPGPPQPQQGQQVPGPPQPQQGQQVPGPPQPQQGQQVPGPPQPQQGQQVPGPPQPVELIKGDGRNLKMRQGPRKRFLRPRSNMQLFFSFIRERYDEVRALENIPPALLNMYLATFYFGEHNTRGNAYYPTSLAAFQVGMEYYLKEKHYGFSLQNDEIFRGAREALEKKERRLRMEGGRETCESKTITSDIKMKSDWEQSREALWEANLLGCKSPESLLRTMFLFNSLYFGLHSLNDHWKLCWGNVHLGITKEGFSFLQYVKNVQDKVSSSASSMQEDVSPIVISARPDRLERCPVRIYMMYAERRPINHCGPLTPFYLKPATCLEYGFQRWYTQQRAGLTRFRKFIQEIKHPLLAQKSWTTLLRVIQGMQIGHEEVHHNAKKEVNESLTTPSMSGSACSNPNMSLDLQIILVKDDDNNPQEETPRKPSQDSTLNSSQTLILHTETLQPQPDQCVQLQRSPTFTPPFIIDTLQAKRFSLTRAIALWFASDAQPPCSVEHPAFCAMLAALNCPSFLIPTCAELSSTTFPLLFKEVCTTVKNCISSLVSSELPVAYSSHVCQGHHNRWLIASVHYVDADWKQHSFCISVRPVVDKQACQLNKDDLDQWSLDKKYPIALVSDLIAGHCVPTSSSYHDLVLPCFSRIIARAVWVGLSEPAMRLLLERARQVGLEVGIRWDERTGDAEERPGYWLEVLHCLRILLEHQSPVCMEESSKTLNCKDTELLKSVLSGLWPLLEASESLMVEHYLPASSIGPIVRRLSSSLLSTHNNHPPLAHRVCEATAVTLVTSYMQESFATFLEEATFFDPRFRITTREALGRVLRRMSRMNETSSCLTQSPITTSSMHGDTPAATPSQPVLPSSVSFSTGGAVQEVTSAAQLVQTLSAFSMGGKALVRDSPRHSVSRQVHQELRGYIMEPQLSPSSCPLSWWHQKEARYPRLANFARYYLCVPATAQSPSAAFSCDTGEPRKAGLPLGVKNVTLASQMAFIAQNSKGTSWK